MEESNMKGVVEGFWDCPYCGTKRIRGRYYYCPNCGKGRGQETQCYPPENITEADLIEDREDIKNPDWYCEYCDSYFNFKFNYCPNCGAERGKKNYFDVRAEQEEKEARQKAIEAGKEYIGSTNSGHTSYDTGKKSSRWDVSYDDDNTDDYSSSHNEPVEYPVGHVTPTPSIPRLRFERRESFMESVWSFVERNERPILVTILVLAFLALMALLLMPRYDKVDVTGKSWTREITVESYEWVDRSGWSLPAGADLQYTQEEIHHYDKVYDHTESYEVPYTVTELVGYNEYTVTHDRGNGYFDVETVRDPIYESHTEYRTEYRDVYRDEPVYATKYYYKIQEWVYNRSYHSYGKEDEPYWPDYELHGNKERIGGRFGTYTITGMRKNKEKSYTTDFDLWNTIHIGQTYEFKVVLGQIVEIMDNTKDN